MALEQVCPARLLQARLALGMIQATLARRVGMNRAMINALDHGKTLPGVVLLAKLAQALDVSTDWLLGRTDTPHDGAWGALAYHAGQLSATNLAWLVALTKTLVDDIAMSIVEQRIGPTGESSRL